MGCCFSSVSTDSDSQFSSINPPQLQHNTLCTLPKSSLVPSFHIDEHGKKVSDVNGERVWSESYYLARKEADKYALLRNESYEKSKKAFADNNKRQAKELSDEGKKYAHLMEEANKKAVHEILQPQNLMSSDSIDLHGLQVHEAVEATSIWIKSQIKSQNYKILHIITGAGNHSDPKKGPVIKPAILSLCENEKWKIEKDEKNHGIIHIML
mmetsp:Transcript_16564/g.16663  ORF Transcript_16564/g.16663 Transcript_16564/m.16663 type:complete len:211 (+) Transcript_16564:146-778(+)